MNKILTISTLLIAVSTCANSSITHLAASMGPREAAHGHTKPTPQPPITSPETTIKNCQEDNTKAPDMDVRSNEGSPPALGT